jgi:hypothetical protein
MICWPGIATRIVTCIAWGEKASMRQPTLGGRGKASNRQPALGGNCPQPCRYRRLAWLCIKPSTRVSQASPPLRVVDGLTETDPGPPPPQVELTL